MTVKNDCACEAVRKGDAAATRRVLSQLLPTAPWPCDTDGHTPLHWAAMADSGALLVLVLSYVNVSRPVDVRSTADSQAGQTPLHWACVGGHVDAVRTLLARGADPSIGDGKGYSAATHVVHYGRVDLLHLLLTKSPGLVSMMDTEGHSLLQWAAYYDHFPIVSYLLAVWQVDTEAVDKTGMTALHRAAQRDNATVLEALLRAGADCSVRNVMGKSPADLAMEGSRVACLLRVWGEGVLTTQQPVHSRHSAPKYGFVLFYYILCAGSYLRYRAELIRGLPVGFGMNLLLHVCLIMSLGSHLVATFADPGEIPKGNADTLVSYIEKVLADGTSEASLVPSAFCFTCLTPRPPRSKHSRERDRCVRVFDHECPWVNNTVGLYTHKPLLLLVFSTAVAEWLFIDAMIVSLHRNPAVSSLWSCFMRSPIICSLILVHSAISLFCVMLFVTHVRLILRGQTTYEHLTATREKLMTVSYDLGPWRNLTNFLTSTGPGTGKSMTSLSAVSLREVVLSTGEGFSEKGVIRDLRSQRTDTSANGTAIEHTAAK